MNTIQPKPPMDVDKLRVELAVVEEKRKQASDIHELRRWKLRGDILTKKIHKAEQRAARAKGKEKEAA